MRDRISLEMEFLFEDTSQTTKEDLTSYFNELKDYLEHLIKVSKEPEYKYPESSINLPFDEKVLQKIVELKTEMVTPELKYILDIGIGGSNLGTKAIYDALYGYYDLLEPNRYPKMFFADTNDPKLLFKLQQFLNSSITKPEELLINAISKSGSTTETIVNLEIVLEKISYAKERLVVTTEQDSTLWKTAKKLDIRCIPIPEVVGGRFSVFSGVGLFPLAAAGVDIPKLLKGAMEARKHSLNDNYTKNWAFISAVASYSNYVKGKLIQDCFLFAPELESLGKWYRQLLGESLGKDGKGLTPTVSIGPTDLHSMGQLYAGGIKDKFFNLVSVEDYGVDVQVPRHPSLDTLTNIKEKTAGDVIDAILESVKITFQNRNIPFTHTKLEALNETSLAGFMQTKMIEVMFLGKLMQVDTFNQPDVEEYKKETRRILARA